MSRKRSSPCLCPFWHSTTQINAIMIKPEALLILKEKFSPCACQVVESGVNGLFSGFRTLPVNTLQLSISAWLLFFLFLRVK